MRSLTRRVTAFAALGLFSVAAFGIDTKAPLVAQAAKPTTAPTTLPTFVVPESLRGQELAMAAQAAFNRGEYAKALPMLRKQADEVADQPARLGTIQERMRVCERALEAVTRDPNAAATAKIDAPPTAETRKPHPAPKAGEPYEVAIKDLGNFEYDQEKGGNVPDDIKKLNGGTLRVRGFMIPMDQAENITQFALVPSLFACCFGQPPSIQHTVVVSCPKGKAVGYSPDEIVCEGTFKVQEKKDDGYIVSLFEMEVASVKPAGK